MTMTFTKSKTHPLNRIYERLRKRSYRWSKNRPDQRFYTGDFAVAAHAVHEAYVKGVHDALKEVDKKRT